MQWTYRSGNPIRNRSRPPTSPRSCATSKHPLVRGWRTMPRYTSGRCHTPPISGLQCGISAASSANAASACWKTPGRCRAHTGSRTQSSITLKTCCGNKTPRVRKIRPSCSGVKTRSRARSASVNCTTKSRASPRRCAPPASSPATALPATCPTCPALSLPCSQRPASARRGLRARRTLVCRV